MWLVTGGAAGSLRNTVWVRNGSTEIDFEGTVKVTSAWGTALGATMTLRSKCLLSCRNFMPVGHAKTLYDDVGITKSQTFNPNPSGKEPWITNPYWGLTIYKASYGGTEMIAFWFDVRCDYAAAPLSGKGCVIPDFLAELVIFTSAYPTYAAHVRKAQKTGLPSKLRRMYDETQKRPTGTGRAPRVFQRRLATPATSTRSPARGRAPRRAGDWSGCQPAASTRRSSVRVRLDTPGVPSSETKTAPAGGTTRVSCKPTASSLTSGLQ